MKKFFSIVIIAFLLALLLRLFVIEGFVVSGDSMAPTIQNGDYVLINKLAFAHGRPKKDDIVVAIPRELPVKVIKRVVGVPGDVLATSDGAPYKLDPEEYFLEGDNRAVSIDSRVLGGIDGWNIKGKVFGAIRLKDLKYISF